MERLPNYKTEKRPCGTFIQFTKNEPSTIKIISVNGGEAFSRQTHKQRDEFWRILSGTGIALVGKKERKVAPGDELFVPRTTEHRMTADAGGSVFLEIGEGSFDEEDITRLEDRYGRSST